MSKRIFTILGYVDSLDERVRPAQELVIDHRFPMLRWGSRHDATPPSMTDEEIRSKFQLLKKDHSGNDNLLKSRNCEACFRSDIRGTVLGVAFWYRGRRRWPRGVPRTGPKAEDGCRGCGWYDVQAWRRALNRAVGARTGHR